MKEDCIILNSCCINHQWNRCVIRVTWIVPPFCCFATCVWFPQIKKHMDSSHLRGLTHLHRTWNIKETMVVHPSLPQNGKPEKIHRALNQNIGSCGDKVLPLQPVLSCQRASHPHRPLTTQLQAPTGPTRRAFAAAQLRSFCLPQDLFWNVSSAAHGHVQTW